MNDFLISILFRIFIATNEGKLIAKARISV